MTIARTILFSAILLSLLFVSACQQQTPQSLFPSEPSAPGGEESLAGKAYQYGEALPTTEYGLPYDADGLYGAGRVLRNLDATMPDDEAFFFTLPEPFADEAVADSLRPTVLVPGGLVYKRGYVYKGSQWVPFEYTPSAERGGSVKQVVNAAGDMQDTNWISTAADAAIPFDSSEFAPGENYIVAYSCFNPPLWKCGCNQPGEASCKKWTLQKFMVCEDGQVVDETGGCSVPSGDAEGPGGAEGGGTGAADSGTGEDGGTIAAVCAEVIPPADTTTMPTAQSECVPPNTDGTQNVLGSCADEYTVVSYGCGSQTDTCTHEVRYDCGADRKVCSDGVCVDAATWAGSGTGTGGDETGTGSGTGAGDAATGTGSDGTADASGTTGLTVESYVYDEAAGSDRISLDGHLLPLSYGGDHPAYCRYEVSADYLSTVQNSHPQFNIRSSPAGTQSFAIVMKDADIGRYHWVAWNIPKDTERETTVIGHGMGTTVLGEGAQEWDPTGEQMLNGYYGPCLLPGQTHTYTFTIYALDSMLSGFGRQDWEDIVLTEIPSHTLASETITTTYTQPMESVEKVRNWDYEGDMWFGYPVSYWFGYPVGFIGVEEMSFMSSAFGDDGMIPVRYGDNTAGQGYYCSPVPNGAQGISPPFSIGGTTPQGTVSLVLVMEEVLEDGDTEPQWVVWGIDPTIREISEDVSIGSLGPSAVGSAYEGPCPAYDRQREYKITLYAATSAITDLYDVSTDENNVAALASTHALDSVSMTVRFPSRQELPSPS